jgi:hypothetical protein
LILTCHSGARAQHANPESRRVVPKKCGFRVRALRRAPE